MDDPLEESLEDESDKRLPDFSEILGLPGSFASSLGSNSSQSIMIGADLLREYLAQGNSSLLEDALDCFNEALEAEPKNPDAHMGVGTVKFHLKDYNGAIESYNAAGKLGYDPKIVLSRAYFGRSFRNFLKKDYETALDDIILASGFYEAPSQDVDSLISISLKYICSVGSKKFQKGLNLVVPIDDCAFLYVCALRLKLHDYVGAIRECDKYVNKYERNEALGLLLRGSIYEIRGDLSLAKKDFIRLSEFSLGDTMSALVASSLDILKDVA